MMADRGPQRQAHNHYKRPEQHSDSFTADPACDGIEQTNRRNSRTQHEKTSNWPTIPKQLEEDPKPVERPRSHHFEEVAAGDGAFADPLRTIDEGSIIA